MINKSKTKPKQNRERKIEHHKRSMYKCNIEEKKKSHDFAQINLFFHASMVQIVRAIELALTMHIICVVQMQLHKHC